LESSGTHARTFKAFVEAHSTEFGFSAVIAKS